MIAFKKYFILLALICTTLSLYAESAPTPLGTPIVTQGAYLQVLDKITGNMNTVYAKIDEIVQFGTLRIRLKYCQKNPPEDVPESKAFVEIWEEKSEEAQTPLFSNWMFSSSPSISTLEHPVYGVWVKECADIATPQVSNSN